MSVGRLVGSGFQDSWLKMLGAGFVFKSDIMYRTRGFGLLPEL